MSNQKSDATGTTIDRANSFDSLSLMLAAMFRDFQELTKKKPDGVLSARKVALVNRLLTDVQAIVTDEANARYLDLLDEENLPQNSDVVLILGQFDAAMKGFHSKYHGYDPQISEHRWFIKPSKPSRRGS
jgi:hypothetical protein